MKIIEVWDLPLRLFHWSLLILVGVSITTGLLGGIDEMELHMWSGYAILGLVLFRILWGFAGTRYARFANFVRSPAAAMRYLRSLFSTDHEPAVGHNPAAAWMVLVLLLALMVQAGSGLFATDDIFVEGPLSHLVSSDTAGMLTSLHHYNYPVLAALIALHVAAVLYYQLGKRIDLIRPMITGKRSVPDDLPGTEGMSASWRAIPLLLLAALAVYALVEWL